MNLTQRWAQFILRLTHEQELIIAGVQRIHPNVEWEVDGQEFLDKSSMSLAETGYTKAKIKQLTKHYAPQNLERAVADLKWRIENKKYGSGVIYFQGEKKKNTKQDWCMTGMVVSYFPQLKETRATVFYRTAESIKRFRGDLVYLRETVLPMFKDVFKSAPLNLVTFNFANITLHPMYWLLAVEHIPLWDQHLARVKKNNLKLFRHIAYWCWRYLLDESKSIDAYSSAKQVRVIAERCTSPERLQKFKDWLRKDMLKEPHEYPDSVLKWSKKQRARR